MVAFFRSRSTHLTLLLMLSLALSECCWALHRSKAIELPPQKPDWWDTTPVPDVHQKDESFSNAYHRLNDRINKMLAPQKISDFWFAGPFTNEENVGFNRIFKVEADYLKHGFRKDTVYNGKTQRVGWMSPDQKRVDPNLPQITMYAYREIHWNKSEKVPLKIYSDDGVVLWVNRKEAFRYRNYGEHTTTVQLRKGRNELFFKVVNDGGPWDLRIETMRVLPRRCRYKALSLLLAKPLKMDKDRARHALAEQVRMACEFGDREGFKHWTVTGARVLKGKNREAFLKEALRWLEQKNYSDVIPALAKEMTSQDSEEGTLLLWARAQQLTGNFDKSMGIFRQVLNNKSFSEKGRYTAGIELARLLASLGDHRGAIETVQGLLEQFPDKKTDREFARTRTAIEAARELRIVVDVDDDYERTIEQVDRLLQSEKERSAFRSLQRALLSSAGRAVRTDEPQRYEGLADRLRKLAGKHRATYVAFLQPEQDALWQQWQRFRRPELAAKALRQEMDAAARVRRWLELSEWELERGRVECANAFLTRARTAAPEVMETQTARELSKSLSHVLDARRALEPLQVAGARSWSFGASSSFYLTRSRDRQDVENPETLYLPAERDGVFYFANEETVTAVCEGKQLWKYRSGGLACSEVLAEAGVILPAKTRPVIEGTRVFARVLVPQSSNTDARFALVCLDRMSGRERWRTNGEAFAEMHVTSSACLEGGRVLATALTRAQENGDRSEFYLFILDAATGAIVERIFLCANPDKLDGIHTAIATAPFGRDAWHLYIDTGMGLMVCLDRATLQLKWLRDYPRLRPGTGIFRTRLLNRINTSPASDQGVVTFAPSDSAFVFFLEAETGKEVARMSSLAFHSLLGARGQTAYFLGDAITAVDVRTGQFRWQARMDPEKPLTGWLGQKEGVIQFARTTRRLDLEKGTWLADTDLPSGFSLLRVCGPWLAGLKGDRYVIFDRRPKRELLLGRRVEQSGSLEPLRLSASALPCRQRGSIPYPGARIVGYQKDGKWVDESAHCDAVIFNAHGWYGLYDLKNHREVWKRATSSGRITPQQDYVVHIEGNKRRLEVVETISGKTVFAWTPGRRVRKPDLGSPLIHGDQIMFYFSNQDQNTGHEYSIYVYNLKTQKQERAMGYGEFPAPQVAFWDDGFYTLGFPHSPGSDKTPMLVARPLIDEKPVKSALYGSRWVSAIWQPKKRELLMVSPEGKQIAIGKPPFDKKSVNLVKVNQRHNWRDLKYAKYNYRRPLYANERYVVCPWYSQPQTVFDRNTLKPLKLPGEAKTTHDQPLPVGRDQLLFCGQIFEKRKKGGKPSRSPGRVLYLLRDGKAKSIGRIPPYTDQEYVARDPKHRRRHQSKEQVYIKPVGDHAWVFVTAGGYSEDDSHTVWQPAVAYRVDVEREAMDGPYYLPMAMTGGISVCSGEMAVEGHAGISFIKPQKGPVKKDAQPRINARFDTGDFFLLDGFLNEWKPEHFTEIQKGARLAATFDGVKIRLAGVVSGMDQERFTGEDLRLRCTFQGTGFLHGVALPLCGSEIRLGDVTPHGDGFQYTVAADGTLRFEAELPMTALYHKRKRKDREFHLANPPPFRMRLDVQDPGVSGGEVATLGGSSAELRPYEMLWFQPEPIKDAKDFLDRFFEGGQWVGTCEPKWRTGVGLYFLFRPKDKKLNWSLERRIPSKAWLDFGMLRSMDNPDFKMRIFVGDKQIAEKEVKKGLMGEPYRVSLAPYGGTSAKIKVAFEFNGKSWHSATLQQIRISK